MFLIKLKQRPCVGNRTAASHPSSKPAKANAPYGSTINNPVSPPAYLAPLDYLMAGTQWPDRTAGTETVACLTHASGPGKDVFIGRCQCIVLTQINPISNSEHLVGNQVHKQYILLNISLR